MARLRQDLKYLRLDCCKSISDLSICAIARYCKKHEHLDIGGCAISDSSICYIARFCQNISFDVRCCILITYTAIEAIAQHCINLKYLHLQCCKNISKDAKEKLNPDINI